MRCCLRPTLVAAAIAAACLTIATDAAASERVLVVGADAALVHEAVASSSTPRELATRFSPAGLAQLAMDSLGLPTGSLVRLSSEPSAAAQTQLLVQSPVQADLFSRVDAYAMVFVDSADADVLTTVDTASSSGYHKIFELTSDVAAGPSTKIPAVIASALTDSVGARAQCAGSDAVCAGKTLAPTKASASQLASVFKHYRFLDAALSADRALAEELAQTQQLSASIASGKTTSPTAFFAVNFEGVSALLGADKQTSARRAIATEVQALLTALQQSYPHSSGAQIVATSRAATNSVVQQMAASPLRVVDSIVAYGRMLLSFQEKVGSASDDDDDDDDDDDSDIVAGANVTKSDITMEDIAEYQIVLWTSVLLGAVLILVILAMCNMNNKRDSLLYAKFTTSNGGRKFD